MAVKCFNFINFVSNDSSFLCSWWRIGAKLYSQYAPSFQEPIIKKENLDEFLSKVSKEELQQIKFKAAKNDQISSVFYDADIRKFCNYVMVGGNKALGRDLIELSFTIIKHIQLRKYNEETDNEKKEEIILNPKKIFHLAVQNVTPVLTVKKIKKSGTWYKVPCSVTPKHAKFMAMKWLLESAREKDKKEPFEKALAKVLLDASNSEGSAYSKKVELHKLCEANRSYANYKWC